MNKKTKILFTVLSLLLLVLTSELLARAGGGGGSSGGDYGGGSGDGDGLFVLLYMIFRLLPFPLNVIAAAVVIGIFYYKSKNGIDNSKRALRNIPRTTGKDSTKGFNKFKDHNPDFYVDEFKGKVKKAFMEIQHAWSKKDLSNVRRYISDGIYQRFTTPIFDDGYPAANQPFGGY